MKFKGIIVSLAMVLALCLEGCTAEPVSRETATDVTQRQSSPGEVTVVYTNDIHTYIYNTVTDGDGNEAPALRLSNIAAMVKDMRSDGKNVLLVDAGDEIQGSVYGTYDKGNSVIDIMNACGYQLACPGNHEFDYGMDTFMALTEKAVFPYISCNFVHTADNSTVFSGSKIFDIDGTKIAFVGISTPNTVTTTASGGKDFQDEDGNYVYSFIGVDEASDLYESVQAEVDRVRQEADYVIALGHLGINSEDITKGLSSTAVIANTCGIDAFIDAHSHNTVTGEMIRNKNGEDVLLTQTGAYLSSVGVMTISADGEISTELLTAYDGTDGEVAALEEKLNGAVSEQLGEKVGTLVTPLYFSDPENRGQRFIRSMEMNVGDYVADSYYWYFNCEMDIDCDIILVNSGGIRSGVEAGEITRMDMVNVSPFGNQICVIEATGREIIDALEKGGSVAGTINPDWNTPAENPGLFQVAGLKYTIDASVESSVVKDDSGNFVSVDGEYRVRNVQVYNRETGAYEDIDPDRTYRVGGADYILHNNGDGYTMFSDNPVIVDFAGQDSDVLTRYTAEFAGEDGNPVICSGNSPLSVFSGYEINYENPYGAGRMVLENSEF